MCIYTYTQSNAQGGTRCTHTHTQTHTRARVHAHARTHTHIHTQIQTHTHTPHCPRRVVQSSSNSFATSTLVFSQPIHQVHDFSCSISATLCVGISAMHLCLTSDQPLTLKLESTGDCRNAEIIQKTTSLHRAEYMAMGSTWRNPGGPAG